MANPVRELPHAITSSSSVDNASDDCFDPFLSCLETSVEEQSLQQSMDVNRESLKRKLMTRRSVAELADQGIYPPLKTPPAFAEQRKHLERAKAGDILRKKLTLRPDRECLVQNHILEDMNPIFDRSVQECERLQKRSRLQEMLTEHLVHRPGPLDLVSQNILKVEPEQHFDDGNMLLLMTPGLDTPSNQCDLWTDIDDSDSWTFFRESIDSTTQDSPNSAFASPSDLPAVCSEAVPVSSSTTAEMLSPSSLDFCIPSLNLPSVNTDDFALSSTIPEAPDILPLLTGSHKLKQISADTVVARIPTPPDITPLLESNFKVTTQSPAMTTTTASVCQPTTLKVTSSTRGGVTKKSRAKIATKSKVIKFHEYHGPPGTQRNNQTEQRSNVDSSAYSIMLQQQQMLLQWQLQQQMHQQQQQQNSPLLVSVSQNAVDPLTSSSTYETSSTSCTTATVASIKFATNAAVITPSIAAATTASAQSNRPTRLEDMKVADLKEACRRLNLSRTGPKQTLIERLLPHSVEVLRQFGASLQPNNGQSTAVSEKTGQNVIRGATPQPMVPMDIDGSSKSEPTTPVPKIQSQYTVVSGCQTVTVLKAAHGFQTNFTVGNSQNAVTPPATDAHGFTLQSGPSAQPISVIPAPSGNPQQVMLPATTVVNSNVSGQQTNVHISKSHVLQGTLLPAITDTKPTENAIVNQPVHCLPSMPRVPVIFVRPDTTMRGLAFNNSSSVAPVKAQLADSVTSGVRMPSNGIVTSSGNSAVAPVFVFHTPSLLTSGTEQTRSDASVMQDMLLIRQPPHIMQLERLHQSQQELAHAQQEARIRQLNSLDEASRSTSLFWRRPLNGSLSAPLSSSVAVSIQSSSTNLPPSLAITSMAAPSNRTMSSSSSDSTIRHSSTNPLCKQFDGEANFRRATFSYSSTTSLSSSASVADCSSPGTIEDVLEVIMNNGEFHCDAQNGNDMTSSTASTSSRPEFYLPDLGAVSDGIADILSTTDATMDWCDSNSLPSHLQPQSVSAGDTLQFDRADSRVNNVDASDWLDELLTPQSNGQLDGGYLQPMTPLGFELSDPLEAMACNVGVNSFEGLLQMSTSK